MKRKKTKDGLNSRILVISDLHIPYAVKDLIPFLRAIKKRYSPTRIISIGDIVDLHSWSMHTHSTLLPSPQEELELAVKKLRPIYELFPRAEVVVGNHDALIKRRAEKYGISPRVLRPIEKILDCPRGWSFRKHIIAGLPNGQPCYFVHGIGSNILTTGRSLAGSNLIQGHYHTKTSIQYHASVTGTRWVMQVGCMIDDYSPAFDYNKQQAARPILNCGMIINSHPVIIPYETDKKGGWIGRLLH